MCLILTACAALVCAAFLLRQSKKGKASKNLITLTLMYAASALMWSVDGIASVMEGESFFDLSAKDTLLGVIIVAVGLLAFVFLHALEQHAKKA